MLFDPVWDIHLHISVVNRVIIEISFGCTMAAKLEHC
jgi:hypothetical protein